MGEVKRLALKELHLLGFKSFPEKTVIRFSDGITAILGPNGCGKTNILDALRWVLGEQSLSLIRCTKNEELIFAGTKTRPPMNFCEVTLILENESSDLPYGGEIEIKRRYFRTGEMEYFFNRQPCRLKDIEELFLHTGSRAYSLFSLSDMRKIILGEVGKFFEEAAALKKYQENKKETLQKLELTERDLERIEDILRERKRIVRILARQKRKWEISFALREEEKKLILSELAERYQKVKREWEAAKKEEESLTERENALRQEIAEREEKVREKKADLSGREERREAVLRELTKLKEDLSRLNEERIKFQERLAYLKESRERQRERNLSLRQKSEEQTSFLERERPRLQELKRREEEFDKEIESLRQEVRAIEENLTRREEERERYEVRRREFFEAMVNLATALSGKRASLLRLEKELFGEKRVGAPNGENILGMVRDLLSPQPGYEKAVACALFPYYSFYLIFDLNLCPEPGERETGFIAMSKRGLRPLINREVPLPPLTNFVKAKGELPGFILSLLNETFLAPDYNSALSFSLRYPAFAFVTKDGISLRSGEVLIVSGSAESRLVVEREEIAKKERERAELEKETQVIESALAELEKSLKELKEKSKEKLRRLSELLLELGKIREEKKGLEAEIRLIEKEREETEREKGVGEMAEIDRQIRALEEEERGLSEKREKLARAMAEREELLQSLNLTEGKKDLTELEGEIRERFSNLAELQRLRVEKQMVVYGLFKEMADIKKEAELRFGVDLEREEVPLIEDVGEKRREITQRLVALGEVNPLAKEEYERERDELKEFLKERQDCLAAREDLLTIIKEIDRKVKDSFLTTFEKVREAFREIFAKLMSGGEGDLVLQDPENPLASEITIIARPQGKNPKRLEQLSDGEKALLALSLLFAFYQVRPAPFSFLDEVDAPLDDANVERFANFLQEIGKKTQVVIITHNRLTLEKVDVLLGVTSEEPGVSKVVTVKLSDLT